MKKIENNSKGFVLAETLIVAVFVMWIFTLIYSGFYPLIGEFEKRENYDDIDSKYGAYLVKKLIEDESYQLVQNGKEDRFFGAYKFVRFECKNINDEGKKSICTNIVKNLEIENCDKNGNNCEIYITKYKLTTGANTFKSNVQGNNFYKYQINCISDCQNEYQETCLSGMDDPDYEKCYNQGIEKAFSKGFQDYVYSLPTYTAGSLNSANYRVVIAYHHKKNNNNYHTYATIEVNK